MPLSPDYFLLIIVVSGLAIIITGGLIYMVRCSFCCCPCCTKLKKYGYGEGGRKGSIKQGNGFYTSPTFAISSPEIDHMVFHQIAQTQLYGDFLGSTGMLGPESSGTTGLINSNLTGGHSSCENGWMTATHDSMGCGTDSSTDAANADTDMIMFM